MVDFAISLRASAVMQHALPQIRLVGAVASFNQTNYTAVADTPFAVSIETKVAGEGQQAAHAQLATWLLAQYARLQLLVQDAGNNNVEMPILPFFVAQGPTWSFGAAKMKEDRMVSKLLGHHRTARTICR